MIGELIAFVLASSALPGISPLGPSAPAAPDRPYWTGEYADDFAALSTHARELDASHEAQFSYRVRTTAVYECVSYGADGDLRRQRTRATAHGTAFGFRPPEWRHAASRQ
jgi:hypothetical protein